MRKFILWTVFLVLIPPISEAFSLDGKNSEGLSPAPRSDSQPIKWINVSFNFLNLFSALDGLSNPLENEEITSSTRSALKELSKDGLDIGLSGKAGEVLKRSPFIFFYASGILLMVDPQNPTRAIVLDSVEYLDSNFKKRKFDKEVDGISVEKLGNETYRIFTQSIAGNGKYGDSPFSNVWDIDFKAGTLTAYEFGFRFFASDIDQKGRKDLVVYDDNYHQGYSKLIFNAWVFRWDGQKWSDISDRKVNFLTRLLKQGF